MLPRNERQLGIENNIAFFFINLKQNRKILGQMDFIAVIKKKIVVTIVIFFSKTQKIDHRPRRLLNYSAQKITLFLNQTLVCPESVKSVWTVRTTAIVKNKVF